MRDEVAHREAVEAVVRGDVVAEDRADLLAGLAHIATDCFAPALLDAREAPLRVAGEVAHEVEGVRAEHHEVFAAAALVLLAVPAEFQKFADPALADQVSS